MSNEVEKNNNNSLRWHFWFLVSFSLFLVVTFALYLPLRFEHKALRFMDDHMMKKENGMLMMKDGHDTADNHAQSIYHEEGEVREGLAVNFNITPVPVFVGTSTQLDFLVNIKPGNIPVAAEELQIEHTKLMHVIGVRSDLNEFFHIHPSPDPAEPGVLSVNHVFAKPGLYKTWSEIKKEDTVHSFGHPEISVAGEGERSEKMVSFGRNAIAGNYQVSLKIKEPVAKGREHALSFDLHTLTGREVEVEDYLGAAMHLTIIKDDWKQFIHTHPEEGEGHSESWIIKQAEGHVEEGDKETTGGVDEVVNFHVIFSEAGLYKMFAQFRPQGANLPPDEPITVSFWVKVEEKAPIGISARWLLFIVSAIMIVILGWIVARYLKVKPPAMVTAIPVEQKQG